MLKEQQSNVRMAEPSTSKSDPNEASNISAEKCGLDEADVKSSLAKLVCVTNYNSKMATKHGLRRFFKQFGLVQWVHISCKSKKKQAFVMFSLSSAARLAASAELTHLEMDGRILDVNVVTECRRSIQKKAKAILEHKKRELENLKDSDNLISSLNNDCLLTVFSFLDYQSLICCERVCKRWRSLSLQSWSSIHDIDFSNADVTGQAFTDISTDQVINVLQKVKGHVQSLILGGNQGWQIYQDFPKIIKIICPTIQHITFGGMKGFGYQLLNMLGSKAPHLKSLDFSSCSRIKLNSLQKLIKQKPNLEGLTINYMTEFIPYLHQFTKLKKLTFLGTAMNGEAFKRFLVSSTSLEELTIDGDLILKTLEDDLTFRSLRKLTVNDCNHLMKANCAHFFRCPNLVELTLSQVFVRSFFFQTDSWSSLRSACPNLRLLTLNQERGMDYCYYLTRGTLQGIFRERKQEAMQALSQLQSLTHLNINIKSGVLASEIQSLANLKNLETLIIFSWHCVYKEEDLIYLINELPALKLLDIRGAIVRPYGLVGNTTENSLKSTQAFCARLNSRQSLLEIKITSCGYEKHETRDRWMCGSGVIINQCKQFGVDEITAAEVVPRMRFDDVGIADGRSDDEVEWAEQDQNVDDNAEGDNNPDVFW